MRYIQTPDPFVVRNPITDDPLDSNGQKCELEQAERITFAKFVRLVVSLAAQGQASPDPLMLIDIRNAADKLASGQVWECHDDWWKVLADQCKSMRGMPAQTTLSAESHLRAIVDAPNKMPAALALPVAATPAS